MDPCTLTETGTSFLPLILLAAVVVLSITGLIFYRKKPPVALLVAAFMFSLSLGLVSLSPAVSAQSTPVGCISSSTDDDDSGSSGPGVVLGLTDDFGLMQVPNAIDTWTNSWLAILSNDNPPDGDSYDWSTVDLDPETAGQQTSIESVHPNNDDYVCGGIYVEDFGVLSISLDYLCADEESNTLPIPSDYAVPLFQYTVQTLGGDPAPQPATVTITTQTDPIISVVTASDDYFGDCSAYNPTGLDILLNDSTTLGALDPLTVDLDLSKPGRQTSVTIMDYVISVDSSGELSVIAPPGAWDYDLLRGYYIVASTLGDISNIASFEIGCPPPL